MIWIKRKENVILNSLSKFYSFSKLKSIKIYKDKKYNFAVALDKTQSEICCTFMLKFGIENIDTIFEYN